MNKPISIAKLYHVDIKTVRKQDLVDANQFVLDTTVPQTERATKLLATLHNPYCFRVGDIGVKLEFPENAPPLQQVFASFLKRQKSGL